MAKLLVSEGFSFDFATFAEGVDDLGSGTTLKANDDLWRIDIGNDGQAFVRGHDFTYDNGGTGGDISDDQLVSGSITSLTFHDTGTTGEEAGPVLFKIKGLDDLSAADVHDTIQSNLKQDYVALFKEAFHGNDTLKGADQGDELYGFKGDDTIKGYEGSDDLIGGKGQDRLFGNDGVTSDDGNSDAFIFRNGDSADNAEHADKIFDFVNGEDYIDLSQPTKGDKSLVHIDRDLDHNTSTVTVEAHDGHDKMVIVVVGNDDVHKSNIAFDVA